MRSRARLAAAFALAALCAPGNILRTEIPDTVPATIALEQIAGASDTSTPGWRVEGVWYFSADSLHFGGYSALLPLADNRLRAFSDRGHRFTFLEPDQPAASDPASRRVDFQLVEKRYANEFWDIEGATRDGASGDYWIAFENYHGIQRYSVASKPKGVRVLEDEVDWWTNSGAEAFARLSDGRFVIVAEGRSEALVFPGDPVDGAAAQSITFDSPREGFVVTDMAQLPDGRILMLLRAVEWQRGWPPFSFFLAIADPPRGEEGEVWTAEPVVELDESIPSENYEGLAVRPQPDGRVAVWLIADDNRAAFQRTLVAKLMFDPGAER